MYIDPNFASSASPPSDPVFPPFPEYFHYPVGKSKEYTALRQKTTDKYGYITTLVLVVFVLLIPVQNYLNLHGLSPFNRISYLRNLNHKLNSYIYTGEELHTRKRYYRNFQAYLASNFKAWIFKVSYHSNAIFQIVFWTAVLSSLSLVDIYNGDLIFVAKRLGKITTVCLPTVLFLSLRPSPLPKTIYLSLLPIHKWLSRIIIIQSILHAILYCGFFQKNHTWFKAWKTENLYGWVAISGFIIIMITSLSKLRNRSYRLFYFNHYLFSWIIVICLQFHARPTKVTAYTCVNVSILVGQIAYRVWLTRVTPTESDLKVTNVSPNLLLVEFPNNLIKKQSNNPGAHIRFATYHKSIIHRVYNQIIPNYHPYTLASLPQDRLQKLIIRKSTYEILNNQRYLISGTYDPHLLFITSKNSSASRFSISKLTINAKRILIVIGGSAISFALPILRVMNYHGIPVKIVWVIKDYRDVNILKYFDGFVHGDDFEIFVTGDAEIREEHPGRSMRNSKSRASLISTISRRFSTTSRHSESNETDPLLAGDEESYSEYDGNSLNRENEIENVDISVDQFKEDEEEEDEACEVIDQSLKIDPTTQVFHEEDEEDTHEEFSGSGLRRESIGEPLSRVHSAKTTSSMNDQFIPQAGLNSSDVTDQYIQQFKSCVKNLNLEHKVYKGRPTLNYKYYNWCINEGFTQCSGPVHDESSNLICCRDLPKNKVRQEDIDAEKIWVISAGPQGLVKNVKLWANEYGLKFHEESFNV